VGAAISENVGPNHIWYPVGTGVMSTTDGGKTWTHTELYDIVDGRRVTGVILGVGFFGASWGWAIGRADTPDAWLFHSTDGGRTWERVLTGIPDGQHLDNLGWANHRYGWITDGEERSYITVDGGEHWTPGSPEGPHWWARQ
jgi:photosystem II stability/assembly factor-like uncharacterized protein